MQLIKLFCGKPRFGDYVFLMGEAVVKCAAVADAYDVTYLIPEIVRVKAVGRRRRLRVAELTVTAAQHKAVFVVCQRACAYAVQALGIHQHINIHVCV